MKVSVVIPTFNRASSLIKTLEAICQQTLAPRKFETIIVDDGSTDNTEKAVGEFIAARNNFQWRYVRHPSNKGRSAARNSGIRVARFDTILFTDDDIRPTPCWAEAHLNAHLKANRIVSVTGSVVYPEDWCAQSNYIRYLNSRYLENRTIPLVENGGLAPNFFACGNISAPTKLFFHVGLFNEVIDRGEDSDVGFKLYEEGIPLLFEPRAKAIHYAEAVWSLEESIRIFKKYYQYDAPTMISLHPDCYNKYCYWFVEPPDWRRESVKRVLIKMSMRFLAHPALARALLLLMKKTDRSTMWYIPRIYQYIMLSEAIDAANRREKWTTTAPIK